LQPPPLSLDRGSKSAEIIKGRHWAPATLDGKAVNTAMYVISVWKIDAPPQ
jgi:hypothetical protein